MLADALAKSGPKPEKKKHFASKTENAYVNLMSSGMISGSIKKPPSVPLPGDTSTYFRSSSLGKACAREATIRAIKQVDIEDVVETPLAYLFAKGHAYHYMHQEVILPQIAGEALLGWWRTSNGLLSDSFIDGRPQLWSRAQAEEDGTVFGYEEVQLYDHEYCLSGHPDAIVDWSMIDHKDSPHCLEILEFKTRNGDDFMWSKVDSSQGGNPLPEHVLQVQAYMMMTGIERARIVYIRKGDREWKEGMSSSYSEHVVHASSFAQEQIRSYLLQWRQALKNAHEHGTVSDRRICSEKSCARAKRCPVSGLCFNLPKMGAQIGAKK